MGIFSNPGEYFKKLTEFAKATRGDESIKASARLFYRILCERGNLFGEDGRVEISDWRLMEDMNVNQRTLATIRKVLTEKGWIKFESKGYGEYVYLLCPYDCKNCSKETFNQVFCKLVYKVCFIRIVFNRRTKSSL